MALVSAMRTSVLASCDPISNLSITVNVVGMIVHEGQTLVASAGGQWPPWMTMDRVDDHSFP